MTRVSRGFVLLCLIQLYVDLSECNVNKSWCLSESVAELKTIRENVPHFQMRPSGDVVEKSVKEVFQVEQVREVYAENCRPKCVPRCSEHAKCIWVTRYQPPQCQCDKGYTPKTVDHTGRKLCEPHCDVGCGTNTVCNSPGVCDCREGFKRSAIQTNNCEPICEPQCGPFKSCVKPNVCQCITGYEHDHLGRCQPICRKVSCGQFEVCTKPDTCECVQGYAKVDNKCQPQCPMGCALHKECVRPDVCLCRAGYKPDIYGACQPICSKPCPELEECVGPEQCDCQMGYKKNITGTCQPVCEAGCPAHSYCEKPSKCKCRSGYQMTALGNCEPTCLNCGQHTYCPQPGECQCLQGYHRATPNSENCDPICSKPCGPHAKCTAPGHCDCEPGYQMNANGDCLPKCAPACEEHSYCISPGKCECKAGYTGKGNNCMPVCSDECGDNSYCARPEECECVPGYESNDAGNRNCSSATAMWIIIFLGVVSLIAVIALISCIAFVFSRRYKKPSYVTHVDNVGSDMHNVDIGRIDTRLEGIDNSSYM